MMKLLIFKEYYAPKINEMTGRIHGIYFSPCNFRCCFCSQSKRNDGVDYPSYSLDEFEAIVVELMDSSCMFKLTGGEPTVVPEIIDVMRVIKKHGGKVFLDTNGSQFELIKAAINEGLIDVIGVSIKGLTPEESIRRSGINNRYLCWDSIIKTCNYSFNKAIVILTYVIDDNLIMDNMKTFVQRIGSDIRIDYFKLNNLFGDELPDPTCRPLGKAQFDDCIDDVLSFNPELRGKIIVIDGFDAVKDKEAIRYY